MDTEFGSFLRKKTLKNQLNMDNLSKKAGISRKTLYNLLNGDVGEAKFKTLIKIAEALGVHPMELFSVYFQYNGSTYHGGMEGRTISFAEGDDIGFIGDITYPDGEIIAVNTTFEKIWRIQNTGTLHWKERSIICLDNLLKVRQQDGNIVTHGLRPANNRYLLPDMPPHAQIDIAIDFTAPSYPCTVISCWKMVDVAGNYCFPNNSPLSCMVKVISL
ncbi:helix-turn-helix domain-containing protein [Thiothrix subterranea]|uniref:NBR1-Ig-like domain-containing protein n=1 Tax=Thiothrix subterranea TaxID=2735563 RepID=UPI00192BF98D|nr:NBR1-Ig-like domain-containing protein [Thiothrix subterranea]QQZ30648.1 helix-turn-helix domain-containing protein [Thiothrix subterranea]